MRIFILIIGLFLISCTDSPKEVTALTRVDTQHAYSNETVIKDHVELPSLQNGLSYPCILNQMQQNQDLDSTDKEYMFCDEDFHEMNTYYFLGNVYTKNSYDILAYKYHNKGCPSYCPEFFLLVSVDKSKNKIDQTEIQYNDIEFGIQVQIDSNSIITVDSTIYMLSPTEEDASGLPKVMGTKYISKSFIEISDSGKFIYNANCSAVSKGKQ